MVAKNRADTQTEIDSLLATSGSGDISAADVRTTAETAKDSNVNVLETGDQSIASTLNEAILTSNTLNGGWANYQDVATQSTAFAVVGGAAAVKVPNDGLGTLTTNRALPDGVTRLYNISTQQLDLTDLKVDDMFSFRFDLSVTTSSNSQEVEISMVFGIGSGFEFPTIVAQGSKKLAGEIRFFGEASFAVFSSVFSDNPAELRISSDGNCDVVVNGYLMTATLLG